MTSIPRQNSEVPQEIAIVAKGAGITFVGKILGGGVQYLYLVSIARWLGRESFGLFVLGFTIIEFAGVISRLGMEGAVVRFVALYQGLKDDLRTKGTILRTLQYAGGSALVWALIILLIPGSWVDGAFHKAGLSPLIKLLGISLPFTALVMVGVNATQGFQTMTYTLYSQNLFQPVLNLLLAAGLIAVGWEVYGVAAAYVISALLTAGLAMYFLTRVFPPLLKINAIADSRQLFGFSIPFLGITFLILLMLWTDILILGYFRSASEVGIYCAAAKTALLLNIILLNFSHIFSPIISDLCEKKELQKLERLFKTITKWCFSVSFPAFLLIVCLAPDIMTLFGPEFQKGWQPLAILALAQFINVSTGPITHILLMSGRQNLMFVNGLVVAVANILLNYFLIPPLGIVGAALASALAIISLNIVMLLEIGVIMKMYPYDRKFIKPALAGAASFLAIVLVDRVFPHLPGSVKFFLFSLLLLLIYLPVTLLWGLEEEDRLIIDLVKQKFTFLKAG